MKETEPSSMDPSEFSEAFDAVRALLGLPPADHWHLT